MAVTPDLPPYQKGVVSAQKLLATVAAGTGTVTVGVPPNAESLVILLPSDPAIDKVVVQGTTTNVEYPSLVLLTNSLESATFCCIALVSSAVDAEVTVTPGTVPSVPWHVYADSASRLVSDLTLRAVQGANGATVSGYGLLVMGSDGTDSRMLSVDPTGGIVLSGPNQATPVTAVTNSWTDVIPAPPAGYYTKLFSCDMPEGPGAGNAIQLADSTEHTIAEYGNVLGTFPLDGFVTSLGVIAVTSAGTAYIVVRFRYVSTGL